VDALESFRQETRAWLEENCPPSQRRDPNQTAPAWGSPEFEAEGKQWLERLAAKGWTCPTWPTEYGGGGLGKREAKILAEEMGRIGTANPAASFGTAMLGPVLLEFGNEDQKKRFLPDIVHARVVWCQGYSEPGAGSDLASLQTRAVRNGDEYIINGSKIWTTGAHHADWMFCLVRTDPDAPKHNGISFILFSIKDPGVTVKQIELISGTSEFCEVFFDNVRARAENLVGEKNGGWTIAKRLLEHERAMISDFAGAGAPRPRASRKTGKAKLYRGLADTVKAYVGERDGRLADPILRDTITQVEMDSLCFGLTSRRVVEELKSGQGPGHAASMLKWYATELNKRRQETLVSAMGSQALGWEGERFSPQELAQTRAWLRSKGNSIEGGTSEVQMNVLAKRALGLPD
jgi:acyl-CoA dehydrogenase